MFVEKSANVALQNRADVFEDVGFGAFRGGRFDGGEPIVETGQTRAPKELPNASLPLAHTPHASNRTRQMNRPQTHRRMPQHWLPSFGHDAHPLRE